MRNPLAEVRLTKRATTPTIVEQQQRFLHNPSLFKLGQASCQAASGTILKCHPRAETVHARQDSRYSSNRKVNIAAFVLSPAQRYI